MMPLRARPTAMMLLRLALLSGVALQASAAQAAFWDNMFSSESDQDTAQLGPRRLPVNNAGDRTSADALNFGGTQPHAAGAGAMNVPQPQMQGTIDNPGMGQLDAPAPTTPLFASPGLPGGAEPTAAAMPAPAPNSYRPAPEEPGFGDRLLGWAGLGDNQPATSTGQGVSDPTSGPNTGYAAPQAPSMASGTAPNGVEYYDADGYPILAATPQAPARPSIADKTAEASSLSATNQAMEGTRQSFMERGENAFAPSSPGLQAYQPAPLDAPLPTGAMPEPMQQATVQNGPMDELAFGGMPAPAPMQPAPQAGGHQPVNHPDMAQHHAAAPMQPASMPEPIQAPAPLRAARLTDSAPLEAPAAMASNPPSSIDLLAPDAQAPQPSASIELLPAPVRSPEPTAPASRIEASRAEAATQAPQAAAAPVQQAYAAPEAPLAPTPEVQNRAVASRAPANLAGGSYAGTQTAQPIPVAGAPIPLPPPIAAVAVEEGRAGPGEIQVTAPNTPGANRVAPLRYLPDSRYTERRGLKASQ